MKQIILISALLLTITGCGPSNDNIKNACLEMAQTSVGFTGPSKRMDIMKNYGMTIETASAYNQIVGGYSGLLSQAQQYNFKNAEACLIKAFSCQRVLDSLVNGDQDYMNWLMEEMPKCPGQM